MNVFCINAPPDSVEKILLTDLILAIFLFSVPLAFSNAEALR
jgi:hypothetical protein